MRCTRSYSTVASAATESQAQPTSAFLGEIDDAIPFSFTNLSSFAIWIDCAWLRGLYKVVPPRRPSDSNTIDLTKSQNAPAWPQKKDKEWLEFGESFGAGNCIRKCLAMWRKELVLMAKDSEIKNWEIGTLAIWRRSYLDSSSSTAWFEPQRIPLLRPRLHRFVI